MKRSAYGAFALILVASGCTERKSPFSKEQFVVAKLQCKAVDAYVIEAFPNTIGLHGTSDDHTRQAKCFKEKLAGTEVQTVVLGSKLHERP